jgi:predicted porin
LKYSAAFADIFHVGALHKFNGSSGAANTATQVDIGAEYAGASVDAYYSKVNSAISSAPLSAAQVGDLPAAYSVGNSLAGTISDNTAFALMGLYKLDPVKFFLSYEHIKFANPSTPTAAGFSDIGGYILAFVNNDAFANAKIYNVYWAGARYTVVPNLDLTAAYYYVHQSAFGSGAAADCFTSKFGTCSGSLEAASFDADYTVTKRFDVYAGAMYSAVHNGLANGYIFHTTNINPTVGVRFKF